ncbi:paired immunoglobulin-like type 2 receptor beta [Peromyscus californicus insignis]|uniref:paired immunoglobulin-like type 2 receptor beta n=1 Tax=Peromyscus californicus insignis TaxID=564181 RepID=UPI0022A7BCA6|nr:paired immunoglobulin-like type 2 receptor beta [Peromyscus californicus insignis]
MALLVSLLGGNQAMTWILLLLLSAACLQAGHSPGSKKKSTFGVNQSANLSGVQGGSIEIPFSFSFPWEMAQNPQMRILWKWQHLLGEFIYNSSSGYTHEHFKNRLILNWTQPQTSGVLRILNLKEKDQTKYFCQVQLNTTEGMKALQSIEGTQLTVTHAISTTMQSPSIVTSTVTTAGLEDTEDQRNPSLVNLGATVGVVVATAVLITPVYVLMVFLWWKQSCGTWRKASRLKMNPSQGKACHPKEQDDIIIFISSCAANLSMSTFCTPAQGSPKKRLYSVLKAQ